MRGELIEKTGGGGGGERRNRKEAKGEEPWRMGRRKERRKREVRVE